MILLEVRVEAVVEAENDATEKARAEKEVVSEEAVVEGLDLDLEVQENATIGEAGGGLEVTADTEQDVEEVLLEGTGQGVGDPGAEIVIAEIGAGKGAMVDETAKVDIVQDVVVVGARVNRCCIGRVAKLRLMRKTVVQKKIQNKEIPQILIVV